MEPKFAPEQQGTNLGQPASWISPTSACARSVGDLFDHFIYPAPKGGIPEFGNYRGSSLS